MSPIRNQTLLYCSIKKLQHLHRDLTQRESVMILAEEIVLIVNEHNSGCHSEASRKR